MIETVRLDIAKKLKKAGWDKKTEFRWHILYDGTGEIIGSFEAGELYKGHEDENQFPYPAPTVSELLEEVPYSLKLASASEEDATFVGREYFRMIQQFGNKVTVGYANIDTETTLESYVINAPTLEDALALLYCRLKSNKLI